ncbi:MAG: STAS domain-containing protein [Actinobacteria bacterium]|nr:STAS domain-containing protein [Actinomycetota bacterium]
MDLYVENNQVNGWSTVRVTGEIDMSNAPELSDFLAQLIQSEQQDLALDLSGIEFMDSSGLGVLVKTHQLLAEREQSLVIRSPSPQVLRTLEVSGLNNVLSVDHSTRDAAAL